jgi:hypothetical protein
MIFTKTTGRGAASHLSFAMAGALFLGLSSAAIMGIAGPAGGEGNTSDNGEQRDDGDDPGGGFAADDEFVGTLPTQGGDGPLSLPVTAPGFFMEGPRAGVFGSVFGASGSGHASVEVVSQGGGSDQNGPHPDDEIIMTFVGQVSLELDAGVMANSQIEVGVSSSNPFGETMAEAMTENNLLLSTVLEADANLSMPLAEFAHDGFLHEGIHLLTSSRQLGRDQMDISSIGGILLVSQGNVLGH